MVGQLESASASWHGQAASAISAFVTESHLAIADRTGAPVPDLRHGVNLVRNLVLKGVSAKEERTAAQATLKALDRLSVTFGELRHFSHGHLVHTAGALTSTLEAVA